MQKFEVAISTKIDQKSNKTFTESTGFPLESYRAQRDLSIGVLKPMWERQLVELWTKQSCQIWGPKTRSWVGTHDGKKRQKLGRFWKGRSRFKEGLSTASCRSQWDLQDPSRTRSWNNESTYIWGSQIRTFSLFTQTEIGLFELPPPHLPRIDPYPTFIDPYLDKLSFWLGFEGGNW